MQISMAAGPGKSLYAGFNRGGLPGGLKMIAGDTGRVVTIDGRQPVTGIVPDPFMSGHLVVSAGCSHRSLDFGGLYHVSGERFEPFYLGSAIFDLKSSGNRLLAAARGHLLSYDGSRIVSRSPGTFSDINGLTCSETGITSFLVCTDINERVSGPGLTPLLAVPRN
jgi:hypothetical protein